MHSEISPTLEMVESGNSVRFPWRSFMIYRVQVFAELMHVMIQWSPGIEISICRKAFIPAWTLEETESVLLNLGKCSKPKERSPASFLVPVCFLCNGSWL